jgi:hypothetical protein
MVMTKLRTFGDRLIEGFIAFTAWATVITIKVFPNLLELAAFTLVVVGLSLAWSPLGWIGAGVFLWTVAAGSNR